MTQDGKERLALATILVGSLALALLWVVRVPFFQQPDESAHADYAFTLFSIGHPVRTLDRKAATDFHPVVRYLEDATGFRHMRYNSDGRVPAGYGSAAYFHAVDANAPSVSGSALASEGRIPYVAQYYSYLYYALDALAIGVGALAGHGSASIEFLAARVFNLLLLALSLCLTYATLRELHWKPGPALGLLAIVAFFPLTTWVSAYVQPDNLAFTAVALVLYVAVRARREREWGRFDALLGGALGLLALTKGDYFVALAIPVVFDRIVRFAMKKPAATAWVAFGALVAGPAPVLGWSAHAIAHGSADTVATFVAANGDPAGVAARHGAGAFLAYLGTQLVHGWNALFFDGISFVTYWGAISWAATRITFGSQVLTDTIFSVIGYVSQFVAALVAIRIVLLVWPRIARIAHARGAASGLRLLASDVVLNSYLAFVAIILAIYVSTAGEMGTQGRYWLPLILGGVLCATRYAPRVFRNPLRGRVAIAMGAGLLAYSLAGSVAALGTLQARFYSPPVLASSDEGLARFTSVGPLQITTHFARENAGQLDGRTVVIDGWAIDSRSGLPARGVTLEVDGRPLGDVRYGLPRPDVVGRFHDDGLAGTGFSARLALAGLLPGPHEMRLAIAERERAAPYPSRARLGFTIAPDP